MYVRMLRIHDVHFWKIQVPITLGIRGPRLLGPLNMNRIFETGVLAHGRNGPINEGLAASVTRV